MKLKQLLLSSLVLVSASAWADPTYRLFVTNEKSNTVSVIDSRTGKIETTLEIGDRPRGIGLSPDQKILYVALSEENAIGMVDVVTLEFLGKLQAGEDPETFDVHPNGNLYLSNEDDAKATVLDPKTGKIIKEIRVGLEPEGVAVSPKGDIALVTSESTNMVHVIDTASHKVVANILVAARPRGLAFNSDGSLAYVSSEIGNELAIIDTTTHTIIKKVVLDIPKSKPMAIKISPDDKTLYLTTGRAAKVAIINAETLELIATVDVGKRVWGAELSRDGATLYTADGVSNTVSVVDTATQKKVMTIDVGKGPWGLALDD
ncbi:MAG: PQQ-dependent catabolism-associated beta-propeller protein [Gammaproteobacteria bacterium]|nr:PQQ-dependent catabolism-associated beta-propeller protein [Pseudomonadota bacterium]PCH65884.1 MAG: PQQ-dependent catabolism-associated beta-propeller protein [Gammaproteobacteria bacterium]